VRLYAAVTQSAQAGNPHGLPHAWAFLARFVYGPRGTRLHASGDWSVADNASCQAAMYQQRRPSGMVRQKPENAGCWPAVVGLRTLTTCMPFRSVRPPHAVRRPGSCPHPCDTPTHPRVAGFVLSNGCAHQINSSHHASIPQCTYRHGLGGVYAHGRPRVSGFDHHPWFSPCRLLNHLPATRLTATALEAFLRVAGYALFRAYRGQFVKLLQLVDQSFLAALQQVGLVLYGQKMPVQPSVASPGFPHGQWPQVAQTSICYSQSAACFARVSSAELDPQAPAVVPPSLRHCVNDTGK
jgi:GLE1-like protein